MTRHKSKQAISKRIKNLKKEVGITIKGKETNVTTKSKETSIAVAS